MRRRRRGVGVIQNLQYCAFDGTAYITPATSVNAGTVNFTTFWIRATDHVDFRAILGESDYTSDYHILYRNNVLYFRIAGDYATYTTTGLNDSFWHHCVFVRNGADVDLYIDKVFHGTDTLTTGATDTEFDIVCRTGGTSDRWEFVGDIDSIAVYNTDVPAVYVATVPAIVTRLYGGGTPQTGGDILKENGMIFGYNFEDTGVPIIDVSGNGHTGTGTNTVKTRY